jgi:phage gpG-like protein
MVSMAFTSYIVDNDRRFRDAIKRASDAAGDLTLPFSQILADFYRSEQAIFKLKSPGQYPDYKGGEDSRYAKFKEKDVGFRYPLLVRTGALAASLLSKDANGAVAIITPSSLTFGTTIPYGVYHQSDAPRKKIPLRKFLFIGPEAPQFANSDQAGRAGRWLNILNDYTLAKMRQSGAFK